MASRNLLVVAMDDVDEAGVRRAVARRGGDEGAEVKIVVPASKISRLQWLTNDEDAAREQAAGVAKAAADAVSDGQDVETEVGDNDPSLAVEDALRTFPADEIILVTGGETGAGWLEDGLLEERLRRTSIPVTRLDLSADDAESGLDETAPGRDVVEGRKDSTPLFLLGSVAATVWGAAAVVALVALLLWWLL